MDEMREKIAQLINDAPATLSNEDLADKILSLETDTCRIAVVRKNPTYTSDLELDIENWVQEVKDAQ